jgi:hypothetical protein
MNRLLGVVWGRGQGEIQDAGMDSDGDCPKENGVDPC